VTRSKLIERLAELNPKLRQRDVELMVTAIFEEMVAALSRGDRVELRGFGSFGVKHRGARVGRNPRSGAVVQVGEKHVPYFRAGKRMHGRLNSGDVKAGVGWTVTDARTVDDLRH
jgi:integration host factor subunit beta